MDPLGGAGLKSESLGRIGCLPEPTTGVVRASRRVVVGPPKLVATALVAALLASIVVSLDLVPVVLAQELVTTTEVPDIVGLQRDKADTAIEGAGLVVGDVRVVADGAQRGTMLAQSPPGGTQVELGTPVSYAVSAGPTPGPVVTPRPPRRTPAPTPQRVVVPEVRGVPEAEAARRIREAGLAIAERRRRPNESVAAGRAVRTDPAAGTALAEGSTVVLVVSQGPPPVTVPDLIGRRVGNARKAIADAGLVEGEATWIESREPRNTIVSQDPPAGTEARRGSAVSYTVSAGPPMTTVPHVRGLPRAEALAMIETAGLFVDTTETGPDPSIAPGDALGTDPGGGSEVEVGSSVVLTLSAGPLIVADGGLPPEPVLIGVLLALILLAGIGAAGAARLARGPQRSTADVEGRLPTVRTVSHPDPAPTIRIRGGRR
jgi:serine/threonine-protein kinase